jgi:hypothetical protein
MSTDEYDFVVRGSDGSQAAIIELKNAQNLTRKDATQFRRNLVVHGFVPSVPYLLLLSQDRGYLWRDKKPSNLEAPPDAEFPMDVVIRRYVRDLGQRRLSGIEFELLILQWLNDLSTGSVAATEEPERTLASLGLYNLLRSGSVEVGNAA